MIRRRAKKRSSVVCDLETLESRQLMSVSAIFPQPQILLTRKQKIPIPAKTPLLHTAKTPTVR